MNRLENIKENIVIESDKINLRIRHMYCDKANKRCIVK